MGSILGLHPFFNTMVLISSGFSLTYAHVSLIIGAYDGCVCGILSCLAQGITFTWYQWKEYLTARFCINNRSFASIFYMATGFHGAHVQIRTGFYYVQFVPSVPWGVALYQVAARQVPYGG